MPYKDPQKRREADRNRRRLKRAGAVKAAAGGPAEGTQKKLSAPLVERPSVVDVAGAVVEEINRVREAPVETLARARTVGYLAGVLLKALEIGEIERRLGELEAKFLNKEDHKL